MAKIANNFIRGGVNQDADDRLIPNGSVRDLENAITSTSEGDDLGTLENVMGNKIVANIDNLTDITPINPVVIGSESDIAQDRIYYLVASDNWDLVLEYDKANDTLTRIVADEIGVNGFLNFDKDKRITHINVINKSSTSNDNEEDSDLLAWCGDDNPPRIINIERFKASTSLVYNEDDINVIKPQPRQAPDITPLTLEDEGNGMEDNFFIFAYRYRYRDGFYSAISSATENLFTPSTFNINFDTFENEGMVNIYNACDITFDTGNNSVTDIELLYKESNDENWYLIEKLNKVDEGWNDDENQTFRFKNNKNYRVLPQREYNRSFDNVPLSSVCQEYVNGRLFYFNFLEQRDLVDFNGDKVTMNFSLDFDAEDVQNTSFPTSARVLPLATPRYYTKIDFSNITEIEAGSRIEINFNIETEQGNSFNELFSYVFPETITTPLGQMNIALHSDVGLQNALESFRQLFIDSGFSEPIGTTATSVNVNAFTLSYSPDGILNIELPLVTFTIGATGGEIQYFYEELNTSVTISSVESSASMKSIRDYEVGMIFMDKEGRKTTALTSKDNTTYIPIANSNTKNTLKVTIPEEQKVPTWADRYKFVVKKVGSWETFFSNRYYVDGGFRWVKLEGGDINKVNIGDDIIVKRDSDSVQNTLGKVKVLDILRQERNFIPDNTIEDTDIEIIEESGVYIKLRPQGFSLDYAENEFINFTQNSRTSSERPYIAIDIFQKEIPDGLGGVTIEDLPFSSGTIFNIKELKSERQGADQSIVQDTWVANQNYENIYDFFTAVNTYVPPNAPAQSEFPSGITTPYPTGFFETINDDDDYIQYWILRGEIVPVSDTGGDYLIDESGSPILVEFPQNNSGAIIPTHKLKLDGNKPYVMIVKGSEAGTGAGNKNGKLSIDLNIRVVDGYYVFETAEKPTSEEVYYETPETYFIENPHTVNASYPQTEHLLTRYHNCYSMGNGAESYRYKDKFNANFLDVKYTPTGVSEDEYRQLRRFADITWSGIFNDNSGVNGLNEFNLSLANYKDDIDKNYGAGYRLHVRDSDLVLFQEDKVSFVRVGEAELFNADNTSNLTQIENVLGNQVSYTGEYGISKDTDSFAYFGNNLYFTDVKRGVVCRLSNNGIFEISKQGLNSYFRNLLRFQQINQIIGQYDDFLNTYVLHIRYNDTEYVTWFYKEAINETGGGWISKQKFMPEDMVSLNGNLYSFKNGNVYEHNIREAGNYNTFYGVSSPSKFTILMNESPFNRKNYKTIELDGSDIWAITMNTNLDNEEGYINISDFEKQEGVYRAFVRGNSDALDINTDSLTSQGLGEVSEIDDSNLVFNVPINEELNIGDYVVNDELTIIGQVTDVSSTEITLDSTNAQILVNLNVGDYVFFIKPQSVETSGLVGHSLKVNGELNTTNKTELFNVASEVFLSTPNTVQG